MTVNAAPSEPPPPPPDPYIELELFDTRTAASTFEIRTTPGNSFSYSFTKDGARTVVPASTVALRNFSIPAGIGKVFIHFDQPIPVNTAFSFIGGNDPRIKRVLNWQDCPFKSLRFTNQTKLIEVPTSLWNNCIYTSTMFNGCSSFNQNLSSWNTSNITLMGGMFAYCSSFNQSLSTWDTSNVTDMSNMFYRCTALNQPFESWNVGKVTNMGTMFAECPALNCDLNSWNVSSVTNMHAMFYNCTNFNGLITNWNTANVATMNSMFANASAFNRNLSGWNVAKVTDRLYYDSNATVWTPAYKPLFK